MNEQLTKKRRALGKGLGALIPGAELVPSVRRDYFLCPIERISPQRRQPRQRFDREDLEGLVASIREQGIIQPVLVRRPESGEGFEIIAGERRWRAAQLAGLKEIPVVVKDASPAEAFELALVENLQREDLNPAEEAEAFQRLIDDHGYTQAELAARIGKDRSTVANSLRLLGLPEEVREMLASGAITEGHARALLQAASAAAITALARKVAAAGMSVRETERRARALAGKTAAASHARPGGESAEVRGLVDRLQRALGARVKIVDSKGKGRLEITYTSYAELDSILNRILR